MLSTITPAAMLAASSVGSGSVFLIALLVGGGIGAVAAATFLLTMLLVNIRDRKQEARETHVQVVQLTEATVEPALWGRNFPREFDGFQRNSEMRATKYGGRTS